MPPPYNMHTLCMSASWRTKQDIGIQDIKMSDMRRGCGPFLINETNILHPSSLVSSRKNLFRRPMHALGFNFTSEVSCKFLKEPPYLHANHCTQQCLEALRISLLPLFRDINCTSSHSLWSPDLLSWKGKTYPLHIFLDILQNSQHTETITLKRTCT